MLERVIPGRETQGRLVRFLVVGGTAAGVQFLTLAFFKRWFGPHLAFSLSWACSTSTHYTLNRFWALPSGRRDTAQQLVEYLLTAGFSYAINIALFHLCLTVLGWTVMWSAVVAVPPSTVVVFLLLNYRVFRRSPTAK